jgi:hypothetical protein
MKEIYIIFYYNGYEFEQCIQGFVESREEAEKICPANQYFLRYERVGKYLLKAES